MKLIAHIEYKNYVYDTKIEFGSGDSTVKSLGLKAAQSYISQNATTCGLLRHKESVFACPYGSFYLPVDVSRDSKFLEPVLLHPDHSIKTYFRDGEDVYVKLLTKVDINSKGLPYIKPKFEHLYKYENEMKEEDDMWEEVKYEEEEENHEVGPGKLVSINTDYNQQMNDWFLIAFHKNLKL